MNKLPDPRLYPASAPGNMLIHLAQSVIDADANERELCQINLEDSIQNYLERNEVLTLSVALAMVTSQLQYVTLWQALCQVLLKQNSSTQLFAIPIVFVIGTPNAHTFKGSIESVDAIRQELIKHQVIANIDGLTIYPNLVSNQDIAKLSAADLYLEAKQAQMQCPDKLVASAMLVESQGIYLRYLIGHLQKDEQTTPSYHPKAGIWTTNIMNLISAELKTEQSTLFAIVRRPQALLDAMVDGHQVQQDIALQVFISDQIRYLRQNGQEPAVKLSTHSDASVRVELFGALSEKLPSFNWYLSPLDQIEHIQHKIVDLLEECQIRNIHIDTEVHKDTDL